MREGDLIARLGGEEFAVILSGMPSDQARLVCERVRKRLEQTAVQDASGAVIRTTVSVGIARLVAGQDSGDAMKNADGALYRAKQSGRNQSADAA
jgi:diguanylate cyclase (GGDEF)-like protein